MYQNNVVKFLHQRTTSAYPVTLAIIVCLLGACFYAYEFMLQVSPSVIADKLMHDLHIGAAGLGVVSAFYYYAYTPMQIPAGMLYDRFGPRLLMSIAILVCATGALFFSFTTSAVVAAIGRFLMGIGSAFSFTGALILVSRWFAAKYFAFLAGFVQLMSAVGAICGEVVLAKVIEQLGWRHTLLGLASIGAILALAVCLIIRNWPSKAAEQAALAAAPAQASVLKSLQQVIGNVQTWWVALFAFTSWVPMTVFAALWGVPYLVVQYGISVTQASTACAMMWLGVAFACPFIGWWSDYLSKRNLPLIVCAATGFISALLAIYVPNVPFGLMCALLFCLGASAAGQSLAFAIVRDNSSPLQVGTALGFNNMAVVASGALFQPLVGFLLHWRWNGAIVAGVPSYQISDYRFAMLVLPIAALAGLLISKFCLKETHCKMLYSNKLK
jgi:MFS family permease